MALEKCDLAILIEASKTLLPEDINIERTKIHQVTPSGYLIIELELPL